MITNKNTGKAWHTFIAWCLLIDTAQSFWRNGSIWYLIKSAEWHSVVFCLTASNFLTKALWTQFWNSTVHNLSIDIYFDIVYFKTTRIQIVFQRRPAKVCNLKRQDFYLERWYNCVIWSSENYSMQTGLCWSISAQDVAVSTNWAVKPQDEKMSLTLISVNFFIFTPETAEKYY